MKNRRNKQIYGCKQRTKTTSKSQNELIVYSKPYGKVDKKLPFLTVMNETTDDIKNEIETSEPIRIKLKQLQNCCVYTKIGKNYNHNNTSHNGFKGIFQRIATNPDVEKENIVSNLSNKNKYKRCKINGSNRKQHQHYIKGYSGRYFRMIAQKNNLSSIFKSYDGYNDVNRSNSSKQLKEVMKKMIVTFNVGKKKSRF